MRKILAALVAAATIAVATIAVPSAAEARWHGGFFRGPGPFFGGLFAGAVIGSALSAPYYYGPGPYYAGYPYPYPYCLRTRWNGFGWVRYRVC